MGAFVNINGRMVAAGEAVIEADSRAFRYGYGLFETILVLQGELRLEALHWERLEAGMRQLRIAASIHFITELQEEVRRTVRKNGHEQLGRVRLEVWPSTGGLFDGDEFRAAYCIESFALGADVLTLNDNGLVLGIARGMLKSADSYSHIKSCSALNYNMAARIAKEQQWNDAILLNQYGRIAESTIANIFWRAGEAIYTTPLSEGCVNGVMRRHLLAQLPLWGYEVKEQVLDPVHIMGIEELFLTNAIRGIRWVQSCEGRELKRGIAGTLLEKVLRSF